MKNYKVVTCWNRPPQLEFIGKPHTMQIGSLETIHNENIVCTTLGTCAELTVNFLQRNNVTNRAGNSIISCYNYLELVCL